MNAHSNIPMVDRYRLEPLRQVREHSERSKRNDLAGAVGDARVTAEEVAAAAKRMDDARARLRTARGVFETSTAHALALADRYVARCRRALDDAVAEHARARAIHAGRLADVDKASGALTAARADKQVIERHFERWRETQRKLADRREDG
jgi:hypothetical protein